MAKEDAVRVTGKVQEVLPDSLFRVEIQTGQTILAHLAGKMRRFGRRIYQGDTVEVEFSPYDPSKGRITGWKGS